MGGLKCSVCKEKEELVSACGTAVTVCVNGAVLFFNKEVVNASLFNSESVPQSHDVSRGWR